MEDGSLMELTQEPEQFDWSPFEDFAYEPLDLTNHRRAIRLISLLPGSFADLPIKCTLRESSLDSDPLYETLSYCWGSPTNPSMIICNAGRLNVTENLHSALLRLRKEQEPRTLWIDAICINQATSPEFLAEKTQQVGLMRDIYRQSSRTVVWLGSASSESDIAIDVCENAVRSIVLGTTSEEAGEAEGAEEHSYRTAYRTAFHKDPKRTAGKTLPSKSEVAAVERLLKRPWFSRIWVVQEVGTSAEILVTCGDREIDFDVLYFGVYLLADISPHMVKGRPEFLLPILLLSTVREWRRLATTTAEDAAKVQTPDSIQTLDLGPLLLRTRRFGATDARDKLFALYGITKTDLVSLNLKPDYAAEKHDVYKRTALNMIKHSRVLDVLEMPRGQGEVRKQGMLPSWVPDWSDTSAVGTPLTNRDFSDTGYMDILTDKRYIALLAKAMAMNDLEMDEDVIAAVDESREKELEKIELQKSPQRAFAASKGSKAPEPTTDDQGNLCLSGHIVDKITQVGDVLVVPNVDREKFDKFVESDDFSEDMGFLSWVLREMTRFVRTLLEWEDIALKDHKKRQYPNGETIEAAYWQTLCGGYFPESYEQAEADFKVWRKSLRGARLIKNINVFNWKTPGFTTLLSMAVDGLISKPKNRIFATMSEPTVKRRLARTSKGYLGLFPEEAKEGDIIVLLRGGRLPFVLRSSGCSWEMIGASYVHGIMYGELFDEEECSEVRLA